METQTNVNKSKNQKSRKLISSGVFIALYFVVFMIFGMLCMPIPVLYIIMPAIIALFAAPVYNMLIAKAPMHGPLFIAALLPGLFLMLQGNIWVVGLTAALAGLLAEIFVGIGKFKSKKCNLIGYIFFTQNLLGGFLPIWIMRDLYFAKTAAMGQDFVDSLRAMTPTWVLFAQTAAVIIMAVVGFFIANRLFKKHFEKAGII